MMINRKRFRYGEVPPKGTDSQNITLDMFSKNRFTGIKRGFYCTISVLLILCIGLSFTACSFTKIGEKNKQNERKKEKRVDTTLTLDQIEGPYDGTQDLAFLQSVKKVAVETVENGFVYNTSDIKSSLEKAKKGNCHSDCAHLISWALQDMGILTEKQTFYSKKKGILSCDKEGKIYQSLMKHGTILSIDPIRGSNQKELKKILKIGDICCYSLHMNVVAGIDSKGNILYYDGGFTPVEGHKSGGRFMEKLTKPYKRPKMKNSLYTIIRLND